MKNLAKIHRSPHRVLLGICAGIAEANQWNPYYLRYILFLLAPWWGAGFIIYFMLFLVTKPIKWPSLK